MSKWLFLAALVVAQAQGPSPDAIVVEIAGLRSDRGTVSCAVFRSEEGFPNDRGKALVREVVRPADLKALASFRGLPRGTYAVAFYHDENANDRLDTNWRGAPQEGYGASRNPQKRAFGPPRWNDARFDYDGANMKLELIVHY